MKVVPDTSVIVDGRFTEFIKKNEVEEVIIPEIVVGEIEHQANLGLSIGISGLRELKNIREFCGESRIRLSFWGTRATEALIRGAKLGEIDNVIRECARENDATLVTGDWVQKEIAEVKGIETVYLEERREIEMRIEDFFTPNTMSVHIKADVGAFAKVGKPGEFRLERIRDVSYKEAEEIANDIIERARRDRKSFIEMDSRGATVVQLREYRIAITRPPFSEALEITAVRPIVKLSLEDYTISDKLRRRLDERAEGILVSGSPGAGKSTFVQALAEHYASLKKIVKTMEKPRDLVLSEEITQYTALEGSMERTGDILLLVRPDYTIFDEMRTTSDFKVFSDLRLAGVGMVGVVHATRAIDAVQRFIGRVELGVIPQIVDTIIHIEKGDIAKVLTLKYAVKVPSGMTEEDLARPVIEVRDLEDEKLLYEIYSFGEQVVVVPVEEESPGIYRLAEREIERVISGEYQGVRVRAKVTGTNSATIYVNPSAIPALIGKKGKNIERLERMLGIGLNVEELGRGEKVARERERRTVEVVMRKKTLRLIVGDDLAHRKVEVYAGSRHLFNSTVSGEGYINLRKNTNNGKKIIHALQSGEEIYVVPL